jgi:hypothetical protein
MQIWFVSVQYSSLLLVVVVVVVVVVVATVVVVAAVVVVVIVVVVVVLVVVVVVVVVVVLVVVVVVAVVVHNAVNNPLLIICNSSINKYIYIYIYVCNISNLELPFIKHFSLSPYNHASNDRTAGNKELGAKRKWPWHTLNYLPAIYEISGSHSGVVDNAGLLGCETLSWDG